MSDSPTWIGGVTVCGERLNDQGDFDDHRYTWKCAACGHKNSISRDNIYDSYGDFRASQ